MSKRYVGSEGVRDFEEVWKLERELRLTTWNLSSPEIEVLARICSSFDEAAAVLLENSEEFQKKVWERKNVIQAEPREYQEEYLK